MPDFSLKMHQIQFSARTPLQTTLGSSQRSPDPYLDLRKRERRKGREGRGKRGRKTG